MSVETWPRGRRPDCWMTGCARPRASVICSGRSSLTTGPSCSARSRSTRFIILLLTGTFLTLFFQPSMTEVVYHGSYIHLDGVKMSEAYASTLNISFDVRGGLLMRQIHHWAADLFVAAILAHMLRIFFTGAYRKPREANWLIGLGLFTLALLEGLFGYSLPDDLLSGAGLRITEGVLQSLPIVGTYLAFFLFGGPYPGNDIIPRMYILHVLLIPGLLLALITAHLFLMFHQKHTQMPGKGRTDQNVVGAPLYPYFMAKTGAFFFFTFAAARWPPPSPRSTRSGCTARTTRWRSRRAPSLTSTWASSRARCGSCPPGRWNVWGHTIRLERVRPRACCRWGSSSPGPRSGRSWNSGLPAINASITSTTGRATPPPGPRSGWPPSSFYGVLWLEGANDVIADHLDIPLYTITWIARFAVFVVPVRRVLRHQADLPRPAAQGRPPARARRRDRHHPAAAQRRVHRGDPAGARGGAGGAGVPARVPRAAGRIRRRERAGAADARRGRQAAGAHVPRGDRERAAARG